MKKNCKNCRWRDGKRTAMCVPCVNLLIDEIRGIGREEGYRRAIDRIFESAAQAYRRLNDDLAKHVRNLALGLDKELQARGSFFKIQCAIEDKQRLDLQGAIPESVMLRLEQMSDEERKNFVETFNALEAGKIIIHEDARKKRA